MTKAIKAIKEYSATEKGLAQLREELDRVVFDVSSKKGLADAKAARAQLRSLRTTLEQKRKDLKAPALERCRLIDDEAKRITAEIEKLEDPIDAQIKAQEERVEQEREAKRLAEKNRVDMIQARIAELRAPIVLAQAPKVTAAQIAEMIAALDARVIEDMTFEEFVGQAEGAKEATLDALRGMHATAIEREAEAKRIEEERAELAQLRADQEKRDAAAKAERERLEAESRARAEEEARKIREQAAAEAAERRRKEDAERAERQRIEDEERARREAEERERRRIQEERDAEERERIRKEREALAEQKRKEAAERIEREKRERDQAIASASLETAIREALDLLDFLNQGEHIATLKLRAASARAFPSKDVT